jgi:ribosomal-protein-alanine N-acetyltransferase
MLGDPGSPSIRLTTFRDIRAIYDLEREAFPLDYWPFYEIVLALVLPGLLRLKISVDEKLAGFIMVERQAWERRASVATFAIHPDYRRQGLGSRLLEEAERRCDRKSMRLSVRMSNESAIRLYKQAGYLVVGSWPRYYKGGEDALVMEKTLYTNETT